MSEQEKGNTEDSPSGEPQGAFGKDKQYGVRLDQVFALNEPFLLLGGVEDEPVPTKFGMSESVKVLAQKIDPETGSPKGPPIKANTVASAIVEKIKALTPTELAAGPVVQLQIVKSKRQDTNALVLSWMRNLADEDDFSEFGLDPEAVGRVTDMARPASERIPY